ncbi:Amino acid permease family protein [Trichomonas vaginalis G3]|uniref:Amino acid permease family protein n=1 Tax=Trichomonas vaginalis (strain ATCC PRA-98 / G3) TaxID=412133 RepID=A2EL73_TRIV3|nr:amino acid permease family [Trichomonas vaginalis G3]EAY06626.1 Amino acid permease family protein [Trichomonas vaginalis G3]KAI5551674.1 amino acid permease family [Trichomonas vaginalis G3]|eukprot:XP_001318849.1 Amino acid permease family protein [Trichomonas vaginalis G3]
MSYTDSSGDKHNESLTITPSNTTTDNFSAMSIDDATHQSVDYGPIEREKLGDPLLPHLASHGQVNNDSQPKSLARGMLAWHVNLISLGGIIGSCYFLGVGITFNAMGAVPVLIGYFLAGVAVFGVMQSFAELLVNLPRHGSFIAYNREFLGDALTTAIGWCFWLNWVMYVPSECLAFATFMNTYYTIPFKNKAWSDFVWGSICLVLLTTINLFKVKCFGYVESINATLKILVIAFFAIVALFIWFGVIGDKVHPFTDERVGFIGSKIITQGEGTMAHRLFPNGYLCMVTYLIIVLVNFQGSEIVGLSAAETQNPEKNIPNACKQVAIRIIIVYLIPILLITLIVPYDKVPKTDSVFAFALTSYGLKWAGKIFTFITLVSAFSCANSGLYGTVRSIYGLSKEGLAPKFLSTLNKFNSPRNAILFTLSFIWIVFLFGFLSQNLGVFGSNASSLYEYLLNISGFFGTIMWIGIIVSQIIFRIKMKRRGYNPKSDIVAHAMFYPYLHIFSIVLQTVGLFSLLFTKTGWTIFAAASAIFLSIVFIFLILQKCGKISTNAVYAEDEVLFDMKYPQKTYFGVDHVNLLDKDKLLVQDPEIH